MRNFLTGILILCLLAGCGGGGGGTSASGGGGGDARLQGSVTDALGQPVAQALVILGDQSFTALSDQNGNFLFTEIPPADYSLRVIQNGYLLKTGNLTLKAGANTTTQVLTDDSSGLSPTLGAPAVTPDSGLFETSFTVNLNITDHSGSGIAQAALVLVDDDLDLPLSGPAGGGAYQAELTAPSRSGTYHYELFAADNQGHLTRESDSVAFTVLPSAVVSGQVAQSPGGEALAGTTVGDSTGTYTAVTDENGYYSLVLPAGDHTLVAQKTGFADSRWQDLELQDADRFTANLVQYPPFNLNWPVGPVSITVNGAAPGETVSAPVQIEAAASGANTLKKIQLMVGNYTGTPSAESLDRQTLSYLWDPAQTSPEGETFLYLLALDRNYNLCVKRIDLEVNNSGGTVPAQVSNFTAYAYTYGENLYAYSRRTGNPILHLADGNALEVRTAPANASIVLSLSWKTVSGALGYRISRSVDGGAYQFLADLPAVSGSTNYFTDTDPVLTPGQSLLYQIRPYNGAGLGNASTSPEVTILDRFSVELLSPAHQSVGVSLRPTFTWSFNQAVGTRRSFKFYLIRKNGYAVINGTEYLNQTSLVCPVHLANLKVYEWDLFAEAQGSWNSSLKTYLARSYPKDEAQTAPGNTANGSFIFTTAP